MSALILATTSLTRIDMLTNAGVIFEARGSGVDEDALKSDLMARGAGPSGVAMALAEAKAVAVSRSAPGVVIGADQTLDFQGRLFDKVSTVSLAKERLAVMRGADHWLHTAVAVAEKGEIVWSALESPRLWLRCFSDDYLDAYLARNGEKVLSSVGCYQLEGEGAQLFERIEGDYFSVLGLPLLPLLAHLRSRGILAT